MSDQRPGIVDRYLESRRNVRVHETDEGEFVVADRAGWLPGTYATADEARAAATSQPTDQEA